MSRDSEQSPHGERISRSSGAREAPDGERAAAGMRTAPTLSGFQAGGALRPGAVYGERAADGALFDALLEGELAIVLAPRQMGKSSLQVRTLACLRARGFAVASLDMSTLGGAGTTPAQWFLGVVDEIASELGLPDPLPWWEARGALPPAQRWLRYLRQEVLSDEDRPVVVFCDEVDAVLGLDFSADAFFAAIRATVNLRAADPAWARLRFCLLGVATPSELVVDPLRTPFNVGTAIRLEDLTREEAAVFEPALEPYADQPAPLLDEIWRWTRGHPYMTQRLCAAIAGDQRPDADAARRVEAQVERHFLRPGPMGDINLASAARSLLARDRHAEALALYRRVWEGLDVPADEGNALVSSLLLTGMVARDTRGERAILCVRNPIFREVFGRAWLEEHLGRRALLDATAEWIAGGRRDADLLRGAALVRAWSWSAGRPDLAADEVALLLASAELERREEERRSRELQLEQERHHEQARREEAERHLRAQRGLVRWLAAVSLTMAVALAFAGLFYVRLRVAGAGLSEAERAQVEVWRESARLATAQPGHENQALLYALQAADQERRLDGEVTPRTLLTLMSAAEASSHGVRLDLGEVTPSAMLWAPDGRSLLTGDASGRILRWDLATRRPIQSWAGGSARIEALEALGDGFASGDEDGQVRLYGWEGELRRTWTAHAGAPYHAVLSLARSPEGDRLLSSGQDGAVRIWDLQGRQLLTDLSGPAPVAWHKASVYGATWSPNGTHIAAGGEDSRIYVWDARTGALSRSFPTDRDQAFVIRFLDEDSLIYGTQGGWVSRASIGRGDQTLSWLAGRRWISGLWVSDGGAAVLTSSADGDLRRWDGATGALLQTTAVDPAGLAGMSSSPDGARIALRSAENRVRVWNGHSDLAEAAWEQQGEVLDACWLDARRIATASSDHTARVWTLGAGESVRLVHPASVTAVAPAPGGALFTAAADGAVRLWDLRSAKVEASLSQGEDINQLLPASTPGVVFALTEGGAVLRVDLNAGDLRTVIQARQRTDPGDYLGGLAPDGDSLVAPGENDGYTAAIWSLASGGQRVVLRGHQMPVRSAVFAPDGQEVATGARDHSIRLWSAATGALERELRGHSSWVLSLGFSPDGQVLASGSVDGTAMLWDVARGEAFARFEDALGAGELEENPPPIRRVSISPDGQLLLAISGRTARVYPARSSALIARACHELDGQPERASAPSLCGAP